MEIVDINRNVLANLYEQFPESLKDLSMNGNYLLYLDQSIDISQFNLNDLLSSNAMFFESLSVLSSEDIFKIIRLHALRINSDEKDKKEEKSNEEKLKEIQEFDNVMKRVSIVNKKENGFNYEYINIVDSNGNDHLFMNDRNVDITNLYTNLKYVYGNIITPESLINEVNFKLPNVNLNESIDLQNNQKVTEDFENKIKMYQEKYKDDKTIKVLGNQEHDLIVVADLSDPFNHSVVTFKRNEFGDLVSENHKQEDEDENVKSVQEEIEIKDEKQQQIEVRLISDDEFYRLLNSNVPFDEEQQKAVDYYYSFLGDLVLYEDFLVPELRSVLIKFRNYVINLEVNSKELNIHQVDAINKLHEFEAKNLESNKTIDNSLVNENVKKLVLKKDYQKAGYSGTLELIIFALGFASVLTVITLYLLK